CPTILTHYTISLHDALPIFAEDKNPMVNTISSWATVLHTGEGSILWSVVLGLGTLTIPFLMVTGFIIYFKRPRNRIKNKYGTNEDRKSTRLNSSHVKISYAV